MDENDAELLWQLDQDPLVMKYIKDGELPSMKETLTINIPRMNHYRNPEAGWGIWQVNIAATNEYIGWIIVRPMNIMLGTPELDNMEIGWRFKSHTWGNGYATEAANHICAAFAEQSDVERFCAIAIKENVASVKIMKKMGMSFVKEYVHHDPLGDWPVVYYQMAIKR